MKTIFLILLVAAGLSVPFTRGTTVITTTQAMPSPTPAKTSPSSSSYVIAVQNSERVRGQLEKIIEMGRSVVAANCAGDETMIIRFVGRDNIEIKQPMTANKQDLNDALDNLYIGPGQAAIIDAAYLSIESIKDAKDGNKKALILITNGTDLNSHYNEKQLVSLALESKVPIYAVGFVSDLATGTGYLAKGIQAKAKGFLERLTAETGGKVFFPKSSAELADIGKQLHFSLRAEINDQCR